MLASALVAMLASPQLESVMGSCARATIALVVVVLGSARVAAAADAREPAEPPTARLEVVAPPGCATTEDLEARVTQRSARIRFSPDSTAGFALRVEIVAEPSGAVAATLEVSGPDRSRAVRHLGAATCSEALDALALMIAVLLDPRALVAPPEGPKPAEPAVVTEPEPEPPPPPRRWGVAVGAAAHAISGPMPEMAPGFVAGGSVAPEPGTGHRFWSPAARLRWAHDWLADWRAPGGTADFTLDSLELDVCPVALGTSGFAARPCVAAVGSRIAARGSQTFLPESHVQYLMAAGASLWLILGVAPHVALEGSVAAAASLRRDSFAFDPRVFYRVAPMTFTGSLGLGVTFP
jgi:hypothetical protein